MLHDDLAKDLFAAIRRANPELADELEQKLREKRTSRMEDLPKMAEHVSALTSSHLEKAINDITELSFPLAEDHDIAKHDMITVIGTVLGKEMISMGAVIAASTLEVSAPHEDALREVKAELLAKSHKMLDDIFDQSAEKVKEIRDKIRR